MDTKYPSYEVYEKLYARYFKRSVTELTDSANVQKTDKVLDICGGGGRLTRQLVKLSDFVSYLDQEADMIPSDLAIMGVKIYNLSIQDFLKTNKERYNKVFCQQAINYWLNDIDVEQFAGIFEENGLFVFNTFNNKPTEKPMVKEYEYDEANFIETSLLIGDKVHHVQIREGYAPHYTVFDWIPGEDIEEKLSPFFSINVAVSGATAIYKCERAMK
ncbi:hypothetical protein FWH58_03825 [Candidatus Saccharibacteria bacterium]|nr:hypothetical protein [Candidatus Saccharibacteria bacterium]